MAGRKKPRSKTSRSKPATKNQRELTRIENLLGEDFENLAQARKALKAETGPRPNKSTYTVSELSSKKHRSVKTFVTDLENRQSDLDELKKPADYWAAEVYGAKTYSLYPSIDGLAKKLGSYKGLQNENPREAVKNIKIIKVSGQNAMDKYFAARRKQTEASWARTKAKHKVDRKRQRQQAAKLKKFKTQISEQKKLIAKLKRQK